MQGIQSADSIHVISKSYILRALEYVGIYFEGVSPKSLSHIFQSTRDLTHLFHETKCINLDNHRINILLNILIKIFTSQIVQK